MATSEKEITKKPDSRRLRFSPPRLPFRRNKPKKPAIPAGQMTFFEHLSELRTRIIWSTLTVILCTGIAWFVHEDLVNAFLELGQKAMDDIAATSNIKPRFVFLDIVAGFGIYFEVALLAGLLLASPVLVYHILAFMAPALEPESRPGDAGYDEEVRLLNSIRRSVIFFIPLVALFFLAGVAFAYYLVLPSANKFLLNFGTSGARIEPTIDAKKFIGQMSKIMFWSGLVFEMPIFLYLLARLRIVTWKKLAGFWKWALVLSMIVAAFITPSPDLISQAVISVPVFGLFWLGVLFARFA